MPDTLRVALLGCGRIAQYFHVKVLRQHPRVQLVAAADKDEALRQRVQSQVPGIALFDDYRTLLAQDGIDAVVNTLPSGLHSISAIAALESGRHLYLEKPIAISGDEIVAVLSAWKASKRVGMPGFNYRFHPLHQQAKAWLQEERIGKPVAVRSIFTSAARPLPPWKNQRETGGGVLLDLFSHHADLARFFFDTEIQRVTAQVRDVRTQGDTASVSMELACGVTMQSFHSMTTSDVDRFEFHGDQGVLTLDRYAGTLTISPVSPPSGRMPHARSALRESLGAWRRVLSPPGEPSFRRSLDAFVTAALQGHAGTPLPDLLDGAKSLAAVLAAEQSSNQQHPVSPPTFVVESP